MKFNGLHISLMRGFIGGILSLLVFAPNTYAEWYVATVEQVVPRATGDVFVQIKPAPSETGFCENNVVAGQLSRIIIDASDPGANALLATFLTALTMGKQVTVDVPSPPCWEPAQIVTSAGLTK